MQNYCFFDLETASRYQDSICQLAFITQNNGENIVFEKLLDPEDDFDWHNTQIHGITKSLIIGQPTFRDLWPHINPYFENSIIVGHNVQFDLRVLSKNIYHYDFDFPELWYLDTQQILKSLNLGCGLSLSKGCDYFGIQMEKHHDALSDTAACQMLFFELSRSVDQISSFIKKFDPMDQLGYKRNLFRKQNIKPSNSFGCKVTETTRSINEIKDLLTEICSDSIITDNEVAQLRNWIHENHILKGTFPYDKISIALTRILEDGVMDCREQTELLYIINNFIDPTNHTSQPELSTYSFCNQVVCLSGEFSFGTKQQVSEIIEKQGGEVTKGVTKKTSMVLLGEQGNPDFSFSTYGSKVKKALELIEQGQEIIILKENDVKLEF